MTKYTRANSSSVVDGLLSKSMLFVRSSLSRGRSVRKNWMTSKPLEKILYFHLRPSFVRRRCRLTSQRKTAMVTGNNCVKWKTPYVCTIISKHAQTPAVFHREGYTMDSSIDIKNMLCQSAQHVKMCTVRTLKSTRCKWKSGCIQPRKEYLLWYF